MSACMRSAGRNLAKDERARRPSEVQGQVSQALGAELLDELGQLVDLLAAVIAQAFGVQAAHMPAGCQRRFRRP